MSPARSSRDAANKAQENAAPTASATVKYIAAIVQNERLTLGWSQNALAHATLMRHQLVTQVENATRVRLTVDEVMSLAMGLQVPPAVLAGWAQENGVLIPPPAEQVPPFDLPTAPPNPRVLGPRALAPPPRIEGRIYLKRDVHALICNRELGTTIPGHLGVRACTGCGCAVERPHVPPDEVWG